MTRKKAHDDQAGKSLHCMVFRFPTRYEMNIILCSGKGTRSSGNFCSALIRIICS
jgi:hypothetical protein